ncbi:hypothetical protein F2P44_31545 [Massilia sp. CCM 8695]|uniref:Uncharacterized protein n=1 Tax=Massilia frigida TaxID=2609281 RepID=A0ABX0NJP1_9BURK|nr:hypothetical protein [Massilia frigida]NHZ83768.1 hypothetical protein [Massilia frigida]
MSKKTIVATRLDTTESPPDDKPQLDAMTPRLGDTVQPDAAPVFYDEGHSASLEFVRVRVLVQCEHGNCNDVVELDAALLDGLVGVVDPDPSAVEYALSLASVYR